MKNFIYLATYLGLILGSHNVLCQTSGSLVEKAEKEAAIVKGKLDLEDTQSIEVQKIMSKYLDKIQKASQNSNLNRAVYQYEIATIEEEKDNELEECLSENQWIIYNILKKEMNEKKHPKRSKG